MMERNADKVSLLVDGELDDCDLACVIQAMKGDETARTRWGHYHLIRDALRGNLPRQMPVNLAERVSLALEHEPVHFTPRPQSSAPQPSRSPSRTRATLGFALAASLSAIAVFGVGVMELNSAARAPAGMSVASVQSPQPMEVAAVAAQPQPAVSAVQLAAAPAAKPKVDVLAAAGGTGMERTPPRRSSVAVAASPAPADLYDYLVNYHRYAPAAADTQAMLSYVQLVGYGSGK